MVIALSGRKHGTAWEHLMNSGRQNITVIDMIVDDVIAISDEEKNSDIPNDLSGDIEGGESTEITAISTKISKQLWFKFPGKLHE